MYFYFQHVIIVVAELKICGLLPPLHLLQGCVHIRMFCFPHIFIKFVKITQALSLNYGD